MRNTGDFPALDRIDFELLAALSKNARLSNKELAAQVGLAQSTCLVRVRRLVETGVLRGFHADIEPRALGIGLQAMVAVQMRQHSRGNYQNLSAYFLQLPEVTALYYLAGRTDFLLHLAVRDAAHLQEIVVDRISTREEVAHVETNLVFEYHRTGATPVQVANEDPQG
jgi:DNA-binding Lrp family transcriptional regulator